MKDPYRATKVINKVIDDCFCGETQKMIFVGKQLFMGLIKENEFKYKEQYGGLITDELASKMGYQNLVYKGITVCLVMDPKDIFLYRSSY